MVSSDSLSGLYWDVVLMTAEELLYWIEGGFGGAIAGPAIFPEPSIFRVPAK
jgi:hypothetical protein